MRLSSQRLAQLILASLFIALWLPVPSQATVKQELRIRWAGERPRSAQAGREFVGQIELIAPAPGTVEGLEIGGPGWTVVHVDAPRAFPMVTRGQRRTIVFRAIPQDPAQPLTVRGAYNGVRFERSVRLDAASLERKRPARYLDGTGPRPSGAKPRLSPGQTERSADMQIRFHGSVKYVRSDGIHPGADNIVIKIWDEDAISDELIWSGVTDTQGNFDVNVTWDDCDISGCDDPDIYLEIIAANGNVDVQEDDLLETTYSWETLPFDNFNGTDFDFNNVYPGEGQDAAIHIYNSIVRAHRYSSPHGMAPGPVGIFWPDDEDGAYYDEDAEEIHIGPDRTWNELTHSHEFAHHLHNVFGVLLPPDYDNGFCDENGPGHCVWCPENLTDSWNEGFANWYGQIVTEGYPAIYGITPWAGGTDILGNKNEGRYGQDNLGTCKDGNSYPSPITEGYVMALLRDISDSQPDDHDGDNTFDCATDTLNLGADEILQVFRNDDPTTAPAFLTAFRADYPQFDQDLWSAVQNVDPSFGFPLPPPIILGQPAKCVIARLGDPIWLQVIGNGSMLQYQWRRDGVNLTNGGGMTGATSYRLEFTADVLSGGTYDCVVRTCDGTLQVISAASRVTVFPSSPTARPHLSWGENGWAQCGNGTKVTELPPGSYTGLTDVVEVAGGRLFSMALRSDGGVFTWGHTDNGELGNGGGWNNLVPSPQQINLANAVHIAAGHGFAMALLRDGSVWAWGSNWRGQHGDSTWNDHYVPSPTKFSGCIIAIAAGQDHSLALRADGTVLASGTNVLGSLGIGTIGGFTNVPTQVVGLTNVVAIAAGGYGSYALRADGTVWAWGYNDFGQLGNGTNQTSGTPVQVTGLTNIRAIAGSYYNGYAISSTGEAYAWGRGDMGAIGDGSAAWRFTPVPIPGLNNPRKIVTGSAGWAMALMQDGTARAWGYNVNGVLGTGAPNGGYRFSHEPVLGVVAANNIGAGTATAHVLGHMTNVTAVEAEPAEPAPLKLALRVAPVPSRSSTSLAFDLPRSGRVSIAVYDVSGRLVRSIVGESRPAGRHTATWDGRSRSGVDAPAGVYFARLEREGEVLTRRIVLVR